MTDLTRADLAKYIYPIPNGAVVPVGTPYVAASGFIFAVSQSEFTQGNPGATSPRWTAEPIPAPEPTLAEKARAIAEEGAPGGSFTNLARLVAELAERIEAKP